MTDQALVPTAEATPAHRITGKVRAAIEAMVWQGLPRAAAAQVAGISEHGLYKALRKPPVVAAYLNEIGVLRTSERARNIHTLVEVRDQVDNAMARVAAVKELEPKISNGAQVSVSIDIRAGYVIDLTDASGMSHTHTIDAKALGDNDKPDDSV